MKKSIITIFFSFLAVFNLCSQDAYFNYKQFFTPNHDSYIELYALYPIVNLQGGLNFKLNENKVELLVDLKFFKGAEELFSNKYKANSPEFVDSVLYDFNDVYRVLVPDSADKIQVSLLDVNSNNLARLYNLSLDLIPFNKEVFFSDIELSTYVDTSANNSVFTKQGITVYPDVNEYFKSDVNHLYAYFEVYNLDSNKQYYLERNLLDANQSQVELEQYSKIQKLKYQNPKIIIDDLSINILYSGSYLLSYKLYEKQSKSVVASKKIPFFRNLSKPTHNFNEVDFTSVKNSFAYDFTYDSLFKAIASLEPIAEPSEERVMNDELITKSHWNDKDNYDDLARFLFQFWKQRFYNNAGYEWEKYNDKVVEVEKRFGIRGTPGYRSDRGKLFLKYGKPDEFIARDNDNNTYPYEIWFYKRFDVYINRKFLFYDRTLVGKDYVMLHSNVPGYIQNPYWETEIQSRGDNTNKSMGALRSSQDITNDDKTGNTISQSESDRLNQLWGSQDNMNSTFGKENDRVKEMWDRIGMY